MQFALIDDLAVSYRTGGRRGGTPLLFCNSLGSDLRIWDRVVATLGADRPVLRYDLRGHGLSDMPPGDCSIERLAADAADLADATGFGPAVVIGLSVGGQIAQQLAVDRPDLVRGLVLCDTDAKIGTAESWNQRIAAIRAGGMAVIADAVLERWFPEAFHRGRATELRGWRNMLMRTSVEGYAGVCAALRDSDLRSQAAALDVPTLVLCGSEDMATPPDAVRAFAATLPRATFAQVPGAGHLPCIDAPEMVATLISDFLADEIDV